MIINLIKLNSTGRVDFNGTPDLSSYINDEVRGFNDINVNGYILDNGTDDYEIYLRIKGELILRSAINGSDVPYKIDIKYDDFITNLVEIYKKSANTLDILPIIWENILLEIPIRAVNPDDEFEKTSGDGWELTVEE